MIYLKLLLNKYVLGFLGIAGIVGYILIMRANLHALQKSNVELTNLAETRLIIINRIKDDYEQIVKIRDQLVQARIQLEEDKAKLEKTLWREKQSNKKSLEELAIARRTLIESKINNATKENLKCFEALSRGETCK